jgi:hypothetical protein
MASDEQAGYSNSAMTDDSFDVDLKPANDGLNLRIDTLPMTHVAAAKTVESVSNPGGLNGHKDSTPATSHSLNDETTDEIDICSDLPPANIRRDRPFSATGISRKSTGSSRSRVSIVRASGPLNTRRKLFLLTDLMHWTRPLMNL